MQAGNDSFLFCSNYPMQSSTLSILWTSNFRDNSLSKGACMLKYHVILCYQKNVSPYGIL